ncbi:hypothetical protein BHE74_00031283 [Ensete ventricosum]|nr:hypothetical protein BHE74_00031283 [Ensete ventricosum]
MGSHTNTVSQKNATVETLRKVEFRSVFRAPSQKFKILAIPNVLAHGKSYEHGFAKKRDSHKLCAKSSFNQFFVYRLKKFKMMAIPNVLTLWKSYEHSFGKKHDGYNTLGMSNILISETLHKKPIETRLCTRLCDHYTFSQKRARLTSHRQIRWEWPVF